ncbi:MAG TPA: hypothetical protein VLJ84_00985, partial [Usitatibacter sp.]|nr:hypothetical protein [Usitatibacter sp.]
MNSPAALFARLSFCVVALLAAFAAHAAPTTYTWTGFYKDTGMAQFPAMSNAIVNGQYTLYLGSQNFSTGPGKVNTFNAQRALQGTFSTPANDPSVDFFSALTSPVGAVAKGLVVGTDSAHVYLLDGSAFTDITPTAAEFAGNRGVYSGIEYSNRIFIGTGGSAGSAQVWAWDGTAWTQQSLPGF